jgi:hypothetical protein
VGARTKLNQATLYGIAMISGVVGALAQSWIVFMVAAAVLAAGSLHGGDIRLGGGRGRSRK